MPEQAQTSTELKKARGQFFTRNDQVQGIMSDLIAHRTGRALEPSAGDGRLVAALERRGNFTIDAVELDATVGQVCATPIVRGDFFAWAGGRDNTYQVVLGNPPFVAWSAVEPATRASAADVKARFSGKTNLYHLFIDRCADLLAPGGEMVLIVPKEWLYSTSAAPLRDHLAAAGALTHLVDCGEEKLFDDAAPPALVIFRWVKGAAQSQVRVFDGTAAALAGQWHPRTLTTDGRWMLLDPDTADMVAGWGRLSDQFTARVGVVTGADPIYRLDSADAVEHGCVRMMLDTSRRPHPYLDVERFTSAAQVPPVARALLSANEDRLRARQVSRIGDDNWWRYGAARNSAHMDSAAERFFVLAKTRSTAPFFTGEPGMWFTAGVMGLFASDQARVSCAEAVAVLNDDRMRAVYDGMFVTTSGKVSWQPTTLADVPFPSTGEQLRAFLQPAHALAA